MEQKQALIIANGTLPSRSIINAILAKKKFILCADGGANAAKRLRITPDVILGDFDSIKTSTRAYFKNVQLIHIPEQYSTDLEKAIRYCIERNISSVEIIGATGNRIDHSTGSLGCFRKFGNTIEMKIIDCIGEITLIKTTTTITTQRGEKISLIPLERCEGVTTTNLLYELNNDTLALGLREGISNEAMKKHVTISVQKGTLLLYRFHKQ
ncbi:MAG: thiamine diphosphokinase [Bacteroidota bacterium]